MLLILGLTSSHIYAQTEPDSSLEWNTFGHDDLLPHRPATPASVYAASRMPVNPEDQPTQIHVVSREDILLNGFTNLMDVLKTLPGFRTSQPGSAEHGDIFVMRGMLGNVYCKILINGVPIRPSATAGMPLGAQLPIMQAERIEIIYGPAASLYGNDAMAGVINIVIPEVERPVEALAALSLGTGSEEVINLSLGGKLGKDNNVLRYRFYGSSTRVFDYNLEIDSAQWRVDSMVAGHPSFFSASGDLTFPELRELPHESQLLGIRLDYKGLSLQLQSMDRQEHSALGSDPAYVGYNNALNYFADNITTASLQYNKTFGEYITATTILSGVWYEIDRNSAFSGVVQPISSGNNYIYGESQDLQAEQLISYRKKQFTAVGGASVRQYSGLPLNAYLRHPFDEDRLQTNAEGVLVVQQSYDDMSRLDSLGLYEDYNVVDFALFGQATYQLGKLNLVGGLRLDLQDEFGLQFSPRLGANYRHSDKLRFRGSFSRAFAAPSPYYEHNNYVVPTEELLTPEFTFERTYRELEAEIITNLEAAVVYYIKPELQLTAQYYTHRLNNSIIPVAEEPRAFLENGAPGAGNPPGSGNPPGPGNPPGQNQNGNNFDRNPELFIGYNNFSSQSILHAAELTATYNTNRISANAGLHYYTGSESLDSNLSVDAYRFVPQFMVSTYARYKFENGVGLALNMRYINSFSDNIYFRNGTLTHNTVKGFFNLDLATSKSFGKHFSGVLRVSNVLNTSNKGILTNWLTSGSFEYAPQLARTGYLSLIYNLE